MLVPQTLLALRNYYLDDKQLSGAGRRSPIGPICRWIPLGCASMAWTPMDPYGFEPDGLLWPGRLGNSIAWKTGIRIAWIDVDPYGLGPYGRLCLGPLRTPMAWTPMAWTHNSQDHVCTKGFSLVSPKRACTERFPLVSPNDACTKGFALVLKVTRSVCRTFSAVAAGTPMAPMGCTP